MASTLDRDSPLVHPQQRRPCGQLLLQVGGECPRVYVHRVPGIKYTVSVTVCGCSSNL